MAKYTCNRKSPFFSIANEMKDALFLLEHLKNEEISLERKENMHIRGPPQRYSCSRTQFRGTCLVVIVTK